MIVESKERNDESLRVPEPIKRQAIARKKIVFLVNVRERNHAQQETGRERERGGMGEIIRHFVFNAISGGVERQHWPFVDLFSLATLMRRMIDMCLLYGDHRGVLGNVFEQPGQHIVFDFV